MLAGFDGVEGVIVLRRLMWGVLDRRVECVLVIVLEKLVMTVLMREIMHIILTSSILFSNRDFLYRGRCPSFQRYVVYVVDY